MDGVVGAIALQPDGKVLVGGSFSRVNGVAVANPLVRLLPNGTLDPGFTVSTGALLHVRAIALQSDGRILAETDMLGLIRLTSTGANDPSFVRPAVLHTRLYVQPDDKILIGGLAQPSSLTEVRRLNANGTPDASFTLQKTDFSPTSNGYVHVTDFALQPDGRIVVAGAVRDTRLGTGTVGVGRFNVDGTFDGTFTTDLTATGTQIGVFPDGRYLVQHNANVQGDVKRVSQLNASGVIIPGKTLDLRNSVNRIVIPPDGLALITGSKVQRLSSNGLLDANFAPVLGTGFVADPVVMQPDGKILVGGSAGIVRLLPTTSITQNRPPVVTSLPINLWIDASTGASTRTLGVGVDDPDGQVLSASVTSSNPAVIPQGGLSLSGDSFGRGLTLSRPAGASTGVALITLTVSDGLLSTSAAFHVSVVPAGAPAEIGLSLDYLGNPDTNPFRLRWGPVQSGGQIQQYVIQAGTSPGSSDIGSFPVGLTNLLVASAPDGQRIFIRVVGSNQLGAVVSNEVRLQIGGNVAPPGAPILTVNAAANPVSLTWTPSAGGTPRNYTLQVGSAAGATDLGSFAVGTTTNITANAPTGVRFFVRVVATNPGGSAVSNEVSFIVAGPSAPPAPTFQPPVVSGSTVQLAWSGVGAGVSYILLARATPGGPVFVTAPVGASTSLTVPGVPGGVYHLTVVATRGGLVSAESNQVVVAVP